MRRAVVVSSVLMLAMASLVGTAHAADPLAETVWLCRPGMADNPCNQDVVGAPQRHGDPFTMRYPTGQTPALDVTRVDANGATTPEAFAGPEKPPVDCFYVYPTVDEALSNPPGRLGSIPPVPREQHMAVLLAQSARFAGLCRIFAPVYRQATLLELAFGQTEGERVGALDIEHAWLDYWQHHNLDPVTGQRRGVVLLGHSQGSTALTQTIKQHIEPDPEALDHLVSAILLGGKVEVPIEGAADPQPTFRKLPACTRAAGAPMPTRCVVAYSTFEMAPGPNELFGRSKLAGHKALCVNPAALLSGDTGSQALDAYLPTRRALNGNVLIPNGSLAISLMGIKLPDYPTGYARYTDTLTGQCRTAEDSAGTASWLQVDGAKAWGTEPDQPTLLGLHVLDYNVALGDLVRVVDQQSQVYSRR